MSLPALIGSPDSQDWLGLDGFQNPTDPTAGAFSIRGNAIGAFFDFDLPAYGACTTISAGSADVVTDKDIFTELKYALIAPDPTVVNTWDDSLLWSHDEILELLKQRQAKFLLLTGCTMSRTTIGGTPHVYRFSLPGDTALLRYVYWKSVGIANLHASRWYTELVRGDSFQADHGDSDWASDAQSRPTLYMDAEVPTLQVQIAPPASALGVLELVYVPMGATLGTVLSGAGTALSVPQECAPAIKYGVLADMLLKLGRAQDQHRAQAALERWEEGVEATRLLLEGFA